MHKFLMPAMVMFTVISCSKSKPVETDNSSQSKENTFNDWVMQEMEKNRKEMEYYSKNWGNIEVDKKFKFTKINDCDPTQMNYDSLEKYGTHHPFDLKKIETKKNIEIEYSDISNCCDHYVGDINRKNNLLYLKTVSIDSVQCDCDCMHRYKFSIAKMDQEFKSIFLNNKKIY